MLPVPLMEAARRVLAAYEAKGLMVATAESCTGGLVAAALTAVAGSSAVMERGFVTYSNQAKSDMLGIDPALIESHGAVSEQVARAMAQGALDQSRAHATVAITGIAGPGGGSPDKPVGLVHFARADRFGPPRHHVRIFEGDRDSIRLAAALVALGLLLPPPGTAE